MFSLLTLLSLAGTVLACGSNAGGRSYSVTLNGIQNIRQEWTINPQNTREELLARLKEGAREAVRAATGFRQGGAEMRALTWDFDSVKFLQCADTFELKETTPTTTITELVGVTHYCLQKDGVIRGICTGKNCNSKEMTLVPVEYNTWNFRASLLRTFNSLQVARQWKQQMPLDQLSERIQDQIRGDMFRGAALYFN